MVQDKGKTDCCGCGVCAEVCPHDAIVMVEDVKGFKYPIVDSDKCVNCGLCDKVCGFIDDYNGFGKPFKVYAAIHKDINVQTHSTSGGMFSALSDHVLGQGGIVYGAGYCEDMSVCHKRATNMEERDSLRGSKYVQSDITGVLDMVKNDLSTGSMVLFSGTPCQISSLKRFLKKTYKNLLTVDIICNGVPNNKIWREYLNVLETREVLPVTNYEFRDMSNWSRPYESNKVVCGRDLIEKVICDNSFVKLYLSGRIMRPSCYCCKFNNYDRVGDITIADYWAVKQAVPDFYDEKGVSLVLVNSDLGMGVFNAISEKISFMESSVDKCFQRRLSGKSRAYQCDVSEFFWRCYFKHGIAYAIEKYTSMDIKTRIIKKIERLFGTVFYYCKFFLKGKR